MSDNFTISTIFNDATNFLQLLKIQLYDFFTISLFLVFERRLDSEVDAAFHFRCCKYAQFSSAATQRAGEVN